MLEQTVKNHTLREQIRSFKDLVLKSNALDTEQSFDRREEMTRFNALMGEIKT
jgi:hypothetical protein